MKKQITQSGVLIRDENGKVIIEFATEAEADEWLDERKEEV